MKKKKSRKKKNRESLKNSDKVINLEEEREARRRANREKAQAKRLKKGKKSFSDQIMDEVESRERPGKERRTVEAKASEKKKPKKSSAPYFAVIVMAVLVLAIMVMGSFGNIMELKNKESDTKQELSDLKAQKESLERKVDGLGSEEYIMMKARNWLKMARDGEIVFVYTD